MNQVFKVVRCLSTGVFKAVPEFAKSGKKSKSVAISASILSAGIAIASPAIADSAVGDPILSGKVTGQNSIAVGETNTIGNHPDGTPSSNNTATGVYNAITGLYSTAIGNENKAEGWRVTTIGTLNDAKGDTQTAIGSSNTIDTAISWNGEEYSTYHSTAVGAGNYIKGSQASAFGSQNTVRGNHSVAVGDNNYIADNYNPSYQNTAVGTGNRTNGNYNIVLGNYNRADTDSATVTGGSNFVDLYESGAYGQSNSVSRYGGSENEYVAYTAFSDGVQPLMVGDQIIRPTAFASQSRVFVPHGGSYAYGNNNGLSSSQTHAVGNENRVTSDMTGVLGNGNSVSNTQVMMPELASYAAGVWSDSRFAQETEIPLTVSRDSTGNFVIGNANDVVGDNSHNLGNANVIKNDRNVTIGNSNTVDFANNSGGFPQPNIPRLQSTEIASAAFNESQPSNTSSAIIGDTNILNAAGGHILGTENFVMQENTYIVGARNKILSTLSNGPSSLLFGASGSNVTGSDNTIRDSIVTVAGDGNSIKQGSNITNVTGYNNQNKGSLNSVVGNFNILKKEAGGAVGTSNQVYGGYGVEEAIKRAIENSDGDMIGGIDVDGDGIPDYNNVEEARLGQVLGGSYAHGNLNGIDGDAAHIVGNGNTVVGDRSGSFGNNNKIGSSPKIIDPNNLAEGPLDNSAGFTSNDGRLVDSNGDVVYDRFINSDGMLVNSDFEPIGGAFINSDGMLVNSDGMLVDADGIPIEQQATTPKASYADTFAYGNDNVVDAEEANVMGKKNTVSSNYSSVVGNYNSVEGEDNLVLGNNNTATFKSSTIVGSNNDATGDHLFIGGGYNDVSGYESGAVGNANTISNVEGLVEQSYALGNRNNIESRDTFVIGNDSNAGGSAAGSLIFGSRATSSVVNGVAIGNDSTVERENTVSFGSTGAARQLTNVAAATELTDAVNLEQLNASLRDTTGGKNITATRTDNGYEVALNEVVNLTSVTTGTTTVSTTGIQAGAVTLSSTTGLDNAGNRVTSVGDATEQTDAVNLKQLNASLRDTTGDENITATKTDTGFNVALNKAVNVDSVATGLTSMTTDGVRAGSVVLSSTTGLDNAGNRVTSVGDATEQTDAVNLKQLNASLRDTTGGKNITATRTDNGYEVALNEVVNLTSVTTGTTTVSNEGVRAGSVVLSSTTGLDNAGNRVTSVGDATEQTDAVNLKQLNASLRDTTGDENITATKTDTGFNVALNKAVNVDSVATGLTSMTTNGIIAGRVVLSSEAGLNNAGYRVSGVGDAINRDDAVNLGQFTDGLNGLTKTAVSGDKNIISTKTDIGYDLALNKDITAETVTTGSTIISNKGLKSGAVTVTASGVDNAGNRVTSVGDATEQTDAVNLGQVNRIDDRLTRENIFQNNNIANNMTNIRFNTEAINKGFSIGDGKTFTKYNLGDSVSITAGSNTVTTNSATGVKVSLASDISVNTVSTGSTSMSNSGLTAGSVTVSSESGLNNAGYRVTGVGNAINKTDAVNLGQFEEALGNLTVEGVATTVSGDQNIVATTNGNNVSLALAKDVNVNSVNAGNVSLSATSGLNNAGFTVTGVGNAVNQSDAVNLGQLDAVDKRLTDKNAAQDIIINSKADTTYVDAQNAAQNKVINTKLDIEVFEASQQAQNENLKIETDRLDAADKDLQAQVNNKVETTVFEADQARQDADLKKVSDDSQAADKNLQAQVNSKVETTVFEADQARQDALIDTKADKEFIQSTISTESVRYDNALKQATADNSKRLSEIVDKQSIVDLAQDARITDNSSRITDLGYKVAEMDDKFSSAIASTVAFASMPSALNPGETRISGGSGYYNGAGAIAIGLTGSNEDGAYNYKIGSSYTQEGGIVVGAGVSMRVW